MDQEVVIALGSSLAGEFRSREALLEAAVAALPAQGLHVVARSGWWRSAAWPDPSQPAFLNGVAVAHTRHAPEAALAALLAVESEFGRRRGERNAPRTLDLDLIDYAGEVIQAPGLVLPHPLAHRRRFVMGPLAEVAPEWRHPVLGETAAELAATAPDGADAQPVTTSASSREPHSAQDPS